MRRWLVRNRGICYFEERSFRFEDINLKAIEDLEECNKLNQEIVVLKRCFKLNDSYRRKKTWKRNLEQEELNKWRGGLRLRA